MKKRGAVAALVFACVLAAVLGWQAAASAEQSSDNVKIASLIKNMNAMGPSGLADLSSIDIRRWEVPGPGVDVMRARLQETYSVDGVGRDTVELTGWIAVRHGKAYMAEGAKELTWNTAILDTEFVAMELDGQSDVFGPVHVSIDNSRRSFGKVGRIEIPELAKHSLEARLVKNDAAPVQVAGTTTTRTSTPAEDPSSQPGLCEASANVIVKMPKLGLDMATHHPVAWYSLVDTIPPVGHTASIAIEPVRLISGGRAVATLESGIVMFREVVRHVPLSNNDEALAVK